MYIYTQQILPNSCASAFASTLHSHDPNRWPCSNAAAGACPSFGQLQATAAEAAVAAPGKVDANLAPCGDATAWGLSQSPKKHVEAKCN